MSLSSKSVALYCSPWLLSAFLANALPALSNSDTGTKEELPPYIVAIDQVAQGSARSTLQGTVRDSGALPSLQSEPGSHYGSSSSRAKLNQLSDEVYTGGLTVEESKRLADHEVVLVIDRSGSMDIEDCPAPGAEGLSASAFSFVLSAGQTSRWHWCAAETTRLARATSSESANPINVVLFSNYFRTFAHTEWTEIPDIFRKNHPGGSTNLAPALESVFWEYFQRKKSGGAKIKPLAVGVITDGCPDSEATVRSTIINASHAMQAPTDLSITFFLIGGLDQRGEAFVADLDTNLVKEGASFDIVKSVSFSALTKEGLAKALADSLQ